MSGNELARHPLVDSDGIPSSAPTSRKSTYQAAAKQLPLDSSATPSSDAKREFDLGWQRAALNYFDDNALEQKMWIQCTLNGAKQRGDDWIESAFIDDAVSGCSACLPDIVVVNDKAVQKDSDDFKSRAPAPWQRVLMKDDANKLIDNYVAPAENEAPRAACGMPFAGPAPPTPDTYLYSEKRTCTLFQRLCATLYMSRLFRFIFRGGDSRTKFPNVEPAQNFRCGIKGFQERSVIFTMYMVAFFTVIGFSLVIFLRVANSILQTTVNFDSIDTFTLTCTGCKIQITNDRTWAGFFSPSNVIMYLPTTGEVVPLNFPSICSEATRSCDIVMKNYESFSPSNARRLFSDDTVDHLIYPYPTIDLIIPSDWKGRLVINSNNQSSAQPHPTVIVPFQSLSLFIGLYPQVTRSIAIPSLSLNSPSAAYPIIFNGFRGGRYRNVNVDCVTGAFVARAAEFEPNSVVNVRLPMGDVIISANQQIETTVGSIYAATPPFIESIATPGGLSNAKLSFTLTGANFQGDRSGVNLIVPNGTCLLDSLSPFPALGSSKTDVTFTCDFSLGIKSSGPVAGPVLLSYFGGNLMSTGYTLNFAASIGGSTSILSPSVARSAGRRSSGDGCASHPPATAPRNVCAVASASSASVPLLLPGQLPDLDRSVVLQTANNNAASGSFRFVSSAARSISLGSYLYSTGSPVSDYEKRIQSIASCPISYEPLDASTSGRIASMNPNYNIPFEEQENLLSAVRSLDSNNVSFVVIKMKGSGSNLPGYFTLSKLKIYTVIDPNLVKTLSFGLLPIPTLAVNVSLGVGLCPDLSEAVSTSEGFGLGSRTTKAFVGPRISQFYQILSDFLSPELGRQQSGQIFLNYQFQLPVQVLKSGFKAVAQDSAFSSSGFTLVNADSLGSDRESFLLYISVLLPVIASSIITGLTILFILDKVTDHRILMFQTCVEGERLSRIELFYDLAQVPYALKNHVSELVQAAPASAHLQSKFKADLLKVFSLFEITERKPMPEYIQWACKVRATPFSWRNLVKNSILQFFALSSPNDYHLASSNDPDADVLANAGAKESFKRYLFKSIETKYARKVSFTQVALEHSRVRAPSMKPETRVLSGKSKKQINDDEESARREELAAFKKSQFIDIDFSETNDVDMHITATFVKKNEGFVLRTPKPTSGVRQIYDYVVVRSRSFPCDPRFGYCIRNVTETTEYSVDGVIWTPHRDTQMEKAHSESKIREWFEFDLYSLDDFKKLEVIAEDVERTTTLPSGGVVLKFEDPYIIDDKFIDYAFSSSAFDFDNLVASHKRIYVENTVFSSSHSPPGRFARMLAACFRFITRKPSPSPANSEPVELVQKGERRITFSSPTFSNDETIDWNPFKDRIFLTVAAIFYESVESYRAIVMSTGVESFFDMLTVNGSLNLRKWKMLGSIDEIMEEHYLKHAVPGHTQTSRIPAVFESEFENDKFKLAKITCDQSHIEQLLHGAHGSSGQFHADFSLHGPAYSSKDAIRLSGSKLELTKYIHIVGNAQKRFKETIQWKPFQPGCTFEIKWDRSKPTFIVSKTPAKPNPPADSEYRCTVVDDTFRDAPEIKLEFGGEIKNANCHMHVQCFQALQQKVDSLTSVDDSDSANTNMTMYSHQLLDAYKPKGKSALISPFLHSVVCGGAACPMLFFFMFWGYNSMNTYMIHPVWTPAAYAIIVALFYGGIVVMYFLIVYLDFPYIFYGTSLVSYKINHFFFSPLTGAWSPNLRRLFYIVFGFIILADAAVIMLFLIWLALGVVVKPALAVPYFTGVAAFIGNIVSLTASMRKWQDTIVNKVLEELRPMIDRFKPKLLEVIQEILLKIDEGSEVAESSPFAGIAANGLQSVKAKLLALYCSIESDDLSALVSSVRDTKDSAVEGMDSLTKLKTDAADRLQKLKTDAADHLRKSGPGLIFRTPTENEITSLLKSLWSSIREELGLSTRNIIIVLLSSSLILGLFIFFIFIGIGIFSDGEDPFAAVVNAGLTLSAGLGVNQNNQTDDAAQGNAMFDAIVTKFLLILEARLKNTKSILIQIFVVMISSEAESAQIIETLQDMKFGIDRVTAQFSEVSKEGDEEKVQK